MVSLGFCESRGNPGPGRKQAKVPLLYPFLPTRGDCAAALRARKLTMIDFRPRAAARPIEQDSHGLLNKSRFRRQSPPSLEVLGAAEKVGRNMATADKRRDARESGGKIRRSATQLGFSARETRLIVQIAEKTPPDDVALVTARWPTLSSSGHSITGGVLLRGVGRLLDEVARDSGSELHALALQVHSHCLC